MKIVVLGAGFGGLEATLRLERRFRKRTDVEITLVNDQNFFLFYPLLPQIVSSFVEPRHIVQTIRDIREDRQFNFIRDRVIKIDPEKKLITLSEIELSYDYLIVALGSTTNFFNVPGAEEHCFTFKSLEDAVLLRDHIIDLCEHADHEPDPAVRREMLTFIVVGGGYTGIELVAEIQDFIYSYAVKRYRGITLPDAKLIVLEATEKILTGIDAELGQRARRKLRSEGVEIKTNAQVTRCFDGGLEINKKDIIKARVIIWAAGVRANSLLEQLPVRKDRLGRLVVNEHLQLTEFPTIFAIGDNAVVETAPPGKSPPIAPLAIKQGEMAARNIIHAIENEALEKFSFEPSGYLVSLGMNDAVIDIKGFQFKGYFAWLLWNAVHLFKLVGFKKQVQVALDWWFGTLFPRDSAIIRRPERCAICHKQAVQPQPLSQIARQKT